MPTAVWIFVATVIYLSDSTFANTIKGSIVEVSSGVDYIDWRKKKLNSTAGSPTAHGSLSGLTDDDHTQYSLFSFKTIAVDGQDDVVADARDDTLILVAGSGMTLTTSAAGDSITFASSGGLSQAQILARASLRA